MAVGLNRALQKYFSNVFVSVVRYGSEWQLYCKVIKNGSMIKRFSKVFTTDSEDELGKEVEEYIDSLYEQYSFVYISFFLNSMGQGAIKGTSNSDFEKNSVDVKNVTHLSLEQSFSIYSSYIDINWAKNIFKNVGIDFIFSPFSLTHELILKSSVVDERILYLLNHEDFIAMSVYEQNELNFASFFRTATDENLVAGDEVDNWEEAEEEKGVSNLIELDSLDEGGDEFSSLEDLDDLDDLDHMDEQEDSTQAATFSDIEEKDKDLGHFSNDAGGEDLELFGRDLLVYKYLSSSIKEFYKNELYNGDFIDKVVIYDGYEISPDLIDLIENELMLDIEIHKIDIGESVCDMSIKEAKI